jgi:predicted ArsR family transcriptional regulator
VDRDRVTIQEAARQLGISEGAVRKRVTRGSLEHEKEESGRVYVYLDTEGRRGVDDGQDGGVVHEFGALISRLEGEVEFLRDQLRRQQEIIAQQAVTMRQLSAPREEPQSTIVDQEREEPPESTEGSQTGTQRPWWRRMFGN